MLFEGKTTYGASWSYLLSLAEDAVLIVAQLMKTYSYDSDDCSEFISLEEIIKYMHSLSCLVPEH